ncbi:MAG: hypothetical protein KKH37_05875, partial [Alphaproteobacteria bacterium]|nr:hypothetical protein [Alphaproteobacteria bacterium]
GRIWLPVGAGSGEAVAPASGVGRLGGAAGASRLAGSVAVGVARGRGMGAGLGTGLRTGLGVGVAVGLAAGVGTGVTMGRGTAGTPFSTSTGPCTVGVGVGEGLGGSWKSCTDCADTVAGTATDPVAKARASSEVLVGKRVIAKLA